MTIAAVGLVAAGAGAAATAQVGMDLSASSSVVSAHIEGLSAQGASLTAGHGLLGASGDPVTVVSLRDVGIRTVCLKLRSVQVPLLGPVTVVAELPEEAGVRAKGVSIDARDLNGPMGLGGVDVGRGAVAPSDRTDRDGAGLVAESLQSDSLDVDVAGLHADGLTTSAISVRAERGEGRC